ncbi:sugar ABC transporter permease [Cohnella pontilimi]|uniref:Sugar ABC transporter permease n=1 Tax=Cohnella pontilimi TaxID=2564100 RepID=A0A4U0FC62_9BACL|nr:sugar ABC transporter permease [Cohnella pontilimi]TJY42248.1 sugar ABC transporter permease [Cohnella pontilimi]
MSQHTKELRFVIYSLTPILLLFLVFLIIPIFWGIQLSFFQYDPLASSSPLIWFDNYVRMWKDPIFVKSFLNTFKYVFIAVPANIVITLAFAGMISRVRSARWRNFFRTCFFLPAIAPLSASALIWSTMLRSGGDGLFNMLLDKMGQAKVGWLTDGNTAMISIILMTLWADIAYNIIIFMAGLDAIPKLFYEAAEIDGANAFQRFRHITLPLLQRTTLFVFTMTVISYFQMFPQFQIMTRGGPKNETLVMALNIYNNAFSYSRMGYASAMATVLLIIILVISLIQIRVGRTQWEY